MAKEILILETLPSFRDTERYSVLFFHEVDPLIEIDGVVVIETPSIGLPPIVDKHNLMAASEKIPLDNGSYIFTSEIIERRKGETIAEIVSRVKKLWAVQNAVAVYNLRRKYELSGQWINV